MFVERLKRKREEQGFTQAELARRIGVSRDLYNKYERAGIRPTHETLISLAVELRTTVDYLIGSTNDPTPPAKRGEPLTELDMQRAKTADAMMQLDDDELAKAMEYIQMLRAFRNKKE